MRRINRVAGLDSTHSAMVQQLELRCIASQLRAPSHDSSDREFSEAVDDSRLPCEDSCARVPDALSLIHSPWIDAAIDRRAPPGSKTLENADMIGTWTNRRYQSVTSTGSVAVTQAHSSAAQSSRPAGRTKRILFHHLHAVRCTACKYLLNRSCPSQWLGQDGVQ